MSLRKQTHDTAVARFWRRSHTLLRSSHLYLVLILIISCIPFVRVGLNGIIDQGDSSFPLYPVDFFARMLYAWDEFGGHVGIFNFQQVSHLSFYVFPAFLGLLGLTANLVNRLTMLFYAAILGWSGYYLSRTFLKRSYGLVYTVSGIFLLFNPYIIGELWLGHWFILLSYAAVAFMLIAFARGLNRDGEWTKWAAAIGLSSTVIVPQLRLISVVTFLLGVYLVLYLLSHRGLAKIVHSIRFLLLSGIFSIFANLSWILPVFTDLQSIYSSTFEMYETISAAHPPTFSAFYNIFNLIGYGIPASLYGSFFLSPVAIIAGSAITFLSYCAIVFRPRDFATRFFVIVSALTTAHMVLFVFSPAYLSLYGGLASILPQPLGYFLFPKDLAYLPFLVAMAYAFLLSATLSEITQRINGSNLSSDMFKKICQMKIGAHKFRPQTLACVVIALILLNSSPLFIGVENDPMSPIQPPAYYDEARSWLSLQNADYRIFVIPSSKSLSYYEYSWVKERNKVVTDILPQVSPVPIIRALPGSGLELGSDVVSLAYSLDPANDSILSMLGAKYILVTNDTLSDAENLSMAERVNSSLPNEKTIGQLRFYRVGSYAQSVYAVNSVMPIWGNVDAFILLSQIGAQNFSFPAFAFIPGISPIDASFLIRSSKRILLQADYADDPDLSAIIAEENPVIAYTFQSYSPSSLTPMTNGPYETFLVDHNGTVHMGDPVEVSKGVSLLSPNFDFKNSDLQIQGTSIESDEIEVSYGDSPIGMALNWMADSASIGFHALFLGINATQWSLLNLLSSGGGISLRILGDGSGRELRFSFMSYEERRFQWPLQTLYLNWTGWKEIVLPFSQFEPVKSPNWNDVFGLWIWQDVPLGANVTRIEMSNFARYLGYSAAVMIPEIAGVNGQDQLKAFFGANNSIPIDYKKINPAKYVAYVNSDSAFFLVLNNAYDSGWKAFCNETELKHVEINSYSNAYYVPYGGNFAIEILFVPQRYYEYGIVLSLFALTGELVCFTRIGKSLFPRILYFLRKIRKRKVRSSK